MLAAWTVKQLIKAETEDDSGFTGTCCVVSAKLFPKKVRCSYAVPKRRGVEAK